MGSNAGDGRTLDRRVALDWEDPPSSLLDVEVVVVYRDGSREVVDDRHLSIVEEGLLVEGHPLEPGRRVLQVEVEWTESENPLERLAAFLSTVREDVREWHRNRNRR